MCVYVCISLVYVLMYGYLCVPIDECVHAYVYVNVYMDMYVCPHDHVCVYICLEG